MTVQEAIERIEFQRRTLVELRQYWRKSAVFSLHDQHNWDRTIELFFLLDDLFADRQSNMAAVEFNLSISNQNHEGLFASHDVSTYFSCPFSVNGLCQTLKCQAFIAPITLVRQRNRLIERSSARERETSILYWTSPCILVNALPIEIWFDSTLRIRIFNERESTRLDQTCSSKIICTESTNSPSLLDWSEDSLVTGLWTRNWYDWWKEYPRRAFTSFP